MTQPLTAPDAAPVPAASAAPMPERLGLFAQLREDLATHDGDFSRPGFFALAAYRLGRWERTLPNKLLRLPFHYLHRLLYLKARNVYGIELPWSAVIGRRVKFEHQHGIVVHGSAVIGDDCVIRQGCTLGIRSTDKPFEAPVLGQRVNVGAGAKILGKVVIGDDAAIGANAVVLQDVPAFGLAVGIPAKIVQRKATPAPASPL